MSWFNSPRPKPEPKPEPPRPVKKYRVKPASKGNVTLADGLTKNQAERMARQYKNPNEPCGAIWEGYES